jgi:SAM-dependent methyltransferase
MENSDNGKEYWEKNIEEYSRFYKERSKEVLHGSRLLAWVYRYTVFPIEQKVTRARYKYVCNFIESAVKPGMDVADVGCGNGIFTKLMAAKKVHVHAFDFTDAALKLAGENLTSDEMNYVSLEKLDIAKQAISKVDAAIAIGILPYVEDAKEFIDNIAPYTNRIFFNYLDNANIINNIRKSLLFLNVRKCFFHNNGVIEHELSLHNFGIVRRIKLVTGYILDVQRKGVE